VNIGDGVHRVRGIVSVNGWNERHTAGFLLVVGFGLLMVTAVLFVNDSSAGSQNAALASGLVVTLFGLAILELVVRDAGDRVLGRLGTIAFLVGSLLWIVTDTLALGGVAWVFENERNYVVLASFALASFGWAFLRTGILPRWLGWTSIGWAGGWLALYLSRLVTAPLGLNLMTLLFGLVLLGRSASPGEA